MRRASDVLGRARIAVSRSRRPTATDFVAGAAVCLGVGMFVVSWGTRDGAVLAYRPRVLAAVLAAHPEVHLRVEAHVDPTDPGPVPLSQKRSEQVVAKLIAAGAGATQLEPKCMGGSKTLFPSFETRTPSGSRRALFGLVEEPLPKPSELPVK